MLTRQEYAAMTNQQSLTHFDDSGRARMVDVGEKEVTHRRAIAVGRVEMQPETPSYEFTG